MHEFDELNYTVSEMIYAASDLNRAMRKKRSFHFAPQKRANATSKCFP